MDVEQLAISKKDAQAELQALKEAFKVNRAQTQDTIYRDLKRVYARMRRGKYSCWGKWSPEAVECRRCDRAAACECKAFEMGNRAEAATA